MDIDKLIAIISSCESYLQLETLRSFVEGLEFDSIKDCQKIKKILIEKENQLFKM